MNNKTKFKLVNYYTNCTIFDGWFYSIKECVEQAVIQGVCLDGVDLSGQNLSHANLDDAQMAGVYLRGANFNGANLSEAIFDYADFSGCDLSHACLAVSSLLNVNFGNASFSSTDVTDAIIRECSFKCPSVFSIPFKRAAAFTDCLYEDESFGEIVMKQPPIKLSGLPHDIIFLDEVVRIGTDFISKKDLQNTGMPYLKLVYGKDTGLYLLPALRRWPDLNDIKKSLQDTASVL